MTTMELSEIYKPIQKEMPEVEKCLCSTLNGTFNKSILEVNQYLLDSPGKRIRPALVMFSARAVQHDQQAHIPLPGLNYPLIKIATAVELIHMASLIHDDVIDHSKFRYNKPTINYKNGGDVAIALGDYLYAEASNLITGCDNMDVIRCISSATKAMCEGELIQVCERENINLLKERYINIVTKKTASLFAASCQSGSLISNCHDSLKRALMEYGLNFGIAFQIIDDYLDLVSEKKLLGKTPGQDLKVGEITLPLLHLFEHVSEDEKEELKRLINARSGKQSLKKIKDKIIDSCATQKTKETALYYINIAKEKIRTLADSPFKESLFNLADFVMERGFKEVFQQNLS